MATPLGTVSLYWPATHPPFRWAVVSATVAWAQFIPVSEGTATDGGPMEGTTDRVAPCFSTFPAAGDCRMMIPLPTVIDFWPFSTCNVKWSLAAAALALSSGTPARVGTGWDGVETFSCMATSAPAARAR